MEHLAKADYIHISIVKKIMLEHAKSILPWTELDIPQYEKEINKLLDEKINESS